MANIPTVALSEVQSGQLAPRADSAPFMAGGQAIAQMGRALQDVGGTIGRFAIQKAEHVNRGILANEETIRMQTAANIQDYAMKNADKPETWQAFADSAWKGYEQGRTSRQKAEKWAPDVVNANRLATQDYQARFGIDFQKQTSAGLIRQSNSRLMGNAEEKLRAGDYAGYVATVNTMNLYDDQKLEAIQTGLDKGIGEEFERRMTDATTLTAADRIAAFSEIEAELSSEGGGVYKDDAGEVVGGIEQGTRNRLLREARRLKSAADMDIMQATRELFSAYNLTQSIDLFNAQADAAHKAGMIDGDLTIEEGPDGSMRFTGTAVGRHSIAVKEGIKQAEVSFSAAYAQQQKEAGRQQAENLRISQQQAERAVKLAGDAQAGKITAEQINRHVKAGDISEVQGYDLRAIVNRVAANDLNIGNKLILGTRKTATGRTLTDVRPAMIGYSQAASLAKSDITDLAIAGAKKLDSITATERQTWLASVNELPISLEAKATLMRDYLAAYEVDLIGFDEKAKPDVVSSWDLFGLGDNGEGTVKMNRRKLSKAEVDLRKMVSKAWKQAPGLGEEWSGELLLEQERRIQEFFTSEDWNDDENSKRRAGEMAADMAQEVMDVSAQKLIDASIPTPVLYR